MANFNKAICKRRRVTIASRRASRHQHVERDSITTTAGGKAAPSRRRVRQRNATPRTSPLHLGQSPWSWC